MGLKNPIMVGARPYGFQIKERLWLEKNGGPSLSWERVVPLNASRNLAPLRPWRSSGAW